jgi:HK97 family phage portal protein
MLFGKLMKEKVMNSSSPLSRALYSSYIFNDTPISSFNNYTQDLMDGYLSNETIYSIVNKIAGTASSVPIKLVDKSNREIKRHWVSDLISNPNEDMTFRELYKSFLIYYLSIGQGYLYAPKVGPGITKELDIMPANDVVIIGGSFSEPIKGYKLYLGNQEVMLPKDDVMSMMMFDPRFVDGYYLYGLSPIKVAADIIRNLNLGEKRMEKMLEKGSPPFIISAKTQEGLTEQQQAALEQAYDKKYGDSGNPSKPLISGVELKVDKLGYTAQDLSLIENSKHGMRVLCNVYGVPSVLMNDLDQSTYSNFEQAYIIFYEDTIKPLNDVFQDKLTKFLLKGTNYRLEFDYSKISVLSDHRVDLMVKYDGISYLTPNEKREIFGFSPSNEFNNIEKTTNDNEKESM